MIALPRTLVVLLSILALASVSPAAERSAARALNQVVPSVDLKAVPLADALDYIRDISGANLSVNWKALEAQGIDRNAPVDLQLRRVTVGRALQMILRTAAGDDSLTYSVSDNVVEVTTLELADARLITHVYPIGDLLVEVPDFTNAPTFDLSAASDQGGDSGSGSEGSGGSGGGGLFGSDNSGGGTGAEDTVGMTRDQRTTQLIDLITSTVRPDVWKVNGGTAAITVFRDNLVITAPASVHAAPSSRYAAAAPAARPSR